MVKLFGQLGSLRPPKPRALLGCCAPQTPAILVDQYGLCMFLGTYMNVHVGRCLASVRNKGMAMMIIYSFWMKLGKSGTYPPLLLSRIVLVFGCRFLLLEPLSIRVASRSDCVVDPVMLQHTSWEEERSTPPSGTSNARMSFRNVFPLERWIDRSIAIRSLK